MIPSNFITQQNTWQGHSCFYYGFYVPFYFDDTKIYLRTTQKQVIWSSEAEWIKTSPLIHTSVIHDINGVITISRAAARELEYAVTPSYETKARDMGWGWGLATYWGSAGIRGATIWLYCYGVGCVINNKWYPKWLNCVRIWAGYELLRVRSLRCFRASQYCLYLIRSGPAANKSQIVLSSAFLSDLVFNKTKMSSF